MFESLHPDSFQPFELACRHLGRLLRSKRSFRRVASFYLADAFKPLGIVERTSRGVDLIYRGLLRFGRPSPDYTRSDAHSVVLRLPTADADVGFLRMVLEEEGRLEKPLPLDSLMVLSALRRHRRVSRRELAEVIGRAASATPATLEHLVEQGLVEARRTDWDAPTCSAQLTIVRWGARNAGTSAQEALITVLLP